MVDRKVLVTGATGYTGGAILHSILESSVSSIKQAHVSVLVRRQDQADLLAKAGVTPILIRDLDETHILTQIATDFDVVIHSSNGYHEPSAKALIQGLGERKAKTGKDVHYIHNSGTSNIADQIYTGRHFEEKPRIFSDKDDIYSYEKAREEKEPYAQRTTDISVIENGIRLGVSTYIVMSPLIYGRGSGLFHQSSIQIPLLIKDAITHGQATYVGDGSNVWDHTHIDDTAALYTLLLAKVLSGETIPAGREGFYFGDSGRQSWLDIAKGIAEVGFQLGKLSSKEPQSITISEAGERWLNKNVQLAELGFASRSATSGDKSRELGWKPIKTDDDWNENFLDEFKMLLQG